MLKECGSRESVSFEGGQNIKGIEVSSVVTWLVSCLASGPRSALNREEVRRCLEV